MYIVGLTPLTIAKYIVNDEASLTHIIHPAKEISIAI